MQQYAYLKCLNCEEKMVFEQPMDFIYNARVPWRAVIEVTNLCQLNCIHCFHDAHGRLDRELTTNEIFSLISELKSAGTMQLTITGGEATLRADIIDIIDYSISNDIKVQLLSNGQIDLALLEKLSRFKYKLSVEISLLGVNNTNDQIVQKKGAYEKAINTIKYLHQAGIDVTVNTVVMKQNFLQLNDISNVLKDLNVKWSHSPLIYGDYDCLYRLDDLQLSNYYYAFPDETKLMSKLSRINYKSVNYDVGCNAGNTTVLIAANGDVFPCVWLRELKMGNVLNENFTTIWHKNTLDKFVEFGCKDCLSCAYFPICKRCPAYSYFESGSYSKKPIEWCRQMKAQKEALERHNEH